MNFTEIKNLKGMTLIEVLAALSIMSIIVVAIVGLMSQQLKTFETNQQQTELQENIRGVMDEIVNKVRNNSISTIQILDNSDSSVPDESIGTRILFTRDSSKYFLHQPSGQTNKICRTVITSPLTTKDVDISQLSFQKTAEGFINIEITGGFPKSGGGYTLTYKMKTTTKPRLN